jgi:type I restriction enzyme, S subunit
MSDGNGQPLPPGWCWATLRDCSQYLQYGSSAKASNLGDVPVLRMGNIRTDGSLDLTHLKYLPASHEEFPALLLQPGDLMFNRTNSADLVGKTGVYHGVPAPCSFASYLIRVRLCDGIQPTFVAGCLNSGPGRRWIKAVVNQTVGQANVNGTKLGLFRLPLAPSPEQSRICDALDELLSDLDAAAAGLARARAKLKHYKIAVLKAAVGGTLTAQWRDKHPAPESAKALLTRILVERRSRWEKNQLSRFKKAGKEPPKDWKTKYKDPKPPDTADLPRLPAEWCWVRLEQVLYEIEAGKSFKCIPRRADPGEWGIVKVSAMTWGEFDETENKTVPPGHTIDQHFEIKPGDILLSRANTVELVGAPVLVQQCRPRLLLSDKSMRLLYTESVNKAWLITVLRSPLVRKQLSQKATGTKDGMRNVSQETVLDVRIPLAPTAEQDALVEATDDQLSVIDHLEADLEARLKSAQSLRHSILHHAFTGKLVPQDPKDEPASELLKRIAAAREQRARQAAATLKSNGKTKTPRRRRHPQPATLNSQPS